MDAYFEVCRDGTTPIFKLPWEPSRRCSQFNPTSECKFGTSPAIHVEETRSQFTASLFGFQLINLGSTLITASLAIKVEDASLLYVAQIDHISVYEVETTRLGSPTGVLVDTIRDVPSVRDLSWAEGSDYITVTTDNKVFLHLIESCSERITCEACTGEEEFPLCGWCTVENKCSRRSQCRDSSEDRRWVQSSEQCIMTSVRPDQYVLERPTILHVSVSPRLPEDLTYNCSFSDSGDTFALPHVVQAIVLFPGSLYQCDITATLTDLGVVKKVTNFSFVSVELGIPFATSESALTIYDCDAASSCRECVETENVCGWCLHRELCSGIPDLCSMPAGERSSSFLVLGDSGGSNEVCPAPSSSFISFAIPTPTGSPEPSLEPSTPQATPKPTPGPTPEPTPPVSARVSGSTVVVDVEIAQALSINIILRGPSRHRDKVLCM